MRQADVPRRGAESVTVRVPATSANLGPGFDSLGVALDWTATITLTVLEAIPAAEPADPIERMTVAAAAALYAQAEQPRTGFHATYEGDMPVGRGLGISA